MMLRLLTLSLLLLVVAASALTAQRIPGRASLIVRLHRAPDAKGESELRATMNAAGVRSITTVVQAGSSRSVQHATAGLDLYRVVTLDSTDLDRLRFALAAHPDVLSIHPNHRYTLDTAPNDSLYSEQWALETVDAEGAWRVTLGDSAILIGVLDTGIDFLHPDLRGALAINRAEDANGNGVFDDADLDGTDADGNGTVDDVIGYDFVDQSYANLGDWTVRDPVPADDQGHGTSVSGVIGAVRNNTVGVAGLAPGCRIVTLRAFDATGNAEDDDLAAAVVYAADRGVRVLNMSFGDYYASPLLGDAIRYAQSRGVLVVASKGNEGVDLPHYPADFPGVMGIAATGRTDNITSFSNYGPLVSMSAPGSSVFTTRLGGGWHTQSGTSFSSPYVAATAGLLLSLHPDWRAIDVRSAVELGAEDRGAKGWDVSHGSGRLNARRAVILPAAPRVEITSPEYDIALTLRGATAIVGSAFSPLPFRWRLEYAPDVSNPTWRTVTAESTVGAIDDTLGVIDAATIAPGSYIHRLVLEGENGDIIQRRIPFTVGGAVPRVEEFVVDTVWRFDRRAVAVTLATDVVTRFTLMIRERGTTQPWRAVALEPERSGWTRRHVLFLSDRDLLADVVYEGYGLVETTGGETTMIGAPGAPLTFTRPSEAFPSSGATAQMYSLPYGYTMREGLTLPSGERATAINRYTEGGDYGPLVYYTHRNGAFVALDSVPYEWTPRAFGDADGDGRIELLGQAFDGGIIYGATVPGGSPLASVRYVDTITGSFVPGTFADLDGDGRDEILARTASVVGTPSEWRVWTLDGAALRVTDRITNRTQPPSDGINSYGSPVAAVGDFDGDRRRDILIADEDADAQIERGNGDGTFAPGWTAEHEGDGGSDFIAAADITGDGRDEAIVAWHSRTYASPSTPYQPPFWTVVVYTFDSAMNGRQLWSDRFAYVRPPVPFRSYVAAADLDGTPGAELALLLFPDFRILRWDSANARMVPLYWRSNAIGNAPAVADYNNDGVNEIAVGDGAQIRFLQLDRRPALLPPAAVEAWGTGDSSAHVEWSPVEGATEYVIYRGLLPTAAGGSITLSPIVFGPGLSFEDSGVGTTEGRLLSGRTYAYVIVARRGSEESVLSSAGLAVIHPRLVAVAAEPVSPRSFILRFSGLIGTELRRPGAVDLRRSGGEPFEVSTIVSAGDSALLVTLVRPVDLPETLTVRPTSLLRDFFSSPLDSNVAVSVVLTPDGEPESHFIATRAEATSQTEIVVTFNAPVDPASIEPGFFVLSSSSRVIAVRVDPNDPRRIILTLDPATPLLPTGRYVTITVTGLRDTEGRVIGDGAGSRVALILIGDETFALVRALPQPFSIARDERLRIAGLPSGATVAIHTTTGIPIRELRESDGTGSVEWDARDAQGEVVPSGVYLYEVRLESAGSITASTLRKFLVLP